MTPSGDAPAEIPTGPAIGQAVPDVELLDARGGRHRPRPRPPATRALILFYRSAAW